MFRVMWGIETTLLTITGIGMLMGLISAVKQYADGKAKGFTVAYFTIGLIATALGVMILWL